MTDVIDSILAVFLAVAEWIVETIPKLTTLFWSAEGGLTFLGTCALLSLAVGVAFLLIGIIQRFLEFRA